MADCQAQMTWNTPLEPQREAELVYEDAWRRRMRREIRQMRQRIAKLEEAQMPVCEEERWTRSA